MEINDHYAPFTTSVPEIESEELASRARMPVNQSPGNQSPGNQYDSQSGSSSSPSLPVTAPVTEASKQTMPAAEPEGASLVEEQRKTLRSLLEAHLSGQETGAKESTGNQPLEALINMLYTMTAPAEPSLPRPDSAESAGAKTERENISQHVSAEPEQMPQASDTPVSGTVDDAHELEGSHDAVGRLETTAEPVQAHAEPVESYVDISQNDVSMPIVSADSEAPSASMAEKNEIPEENKEAEENAYAAEEFADSSAASPMEPVQDVALPYEVLLPESNSIARKTEGLVSELHNSVMFNLSSGDKTISLQMPMQANLSLVSLEQHEGEVILKIHLRD